jgi:hypothetical protein
VLGTLLLKKKTFFFILDVPHEVSCMWGMSVPCVKLFPDGEKTTNFFYSVVSPQDKVIPWDKILAQHIGFF